MQNTLQTRWYAAAQAGNALQEYPRPQLARPDWLCLNGKYDYAITASDVVWPAQYDGGILVPYALETALSGVGKNLLPAQRLWYRRSFSVPEDWGQQRVLLHFGAVDWECEVYVNRQMIGSHRGGYCPFSFDITGALQRGENELVVRVYDPSDAGWQQRGKQQLKPGGIFYTATSGIWQTVWLEPVSVCHISSLRITPDIIAKTVRIQPNVTDSASVRITAIIAMKGKVLLKQKLPADGVLPISELHLWSPEDPFLYDLTLEVEQDGIVCDRISSYFGMRSFGIGPDAQGIARLTLNGQPYFQKGLLDQGYWPDSGMTPVSDDAMIYDIQTMKDLGFNMLRKHIKVEPARWYYHCDRLGMIVWQDMISGGSDYSLLLIGVLPNGKIHIKDNKYKWFRREKAEWREDFEQELYEMIDTLYNCVSIGCWVPFNEAWGQFDAKRIGEAVKAYDPSRIVDHASGWHDQKGPDLKSVHQYILPVKLPRTNGRPFALTEYGGYSLITEGHVWNEKKSFGYQMYKDMQELGAHYRKLHERQIIPLIARGLSATVYTQLSDVETEVNGILSYDREVRKIDAEILREINRKLVL